MKLMTALKLSPGSIPIIGNSLEANGTRNWGKGLPTSTISSVVYDLVTIVIIIVLFVVTKTHYKTLKSEQEEEGMNDSVWLNLCCPS